MSGRDAHDRLAPAFVVGINGSPLPNNAMADIIAVTVLEDVEAASTVSLTIVAWDTVQMKPKWIDDPLFQEGNPITVDFGYADRTLPVFSGEITGLEPDFPEGGVPTLVVRGYDRRHRLMRACKTLSYTECKESDIASRIAAGAGLRPEVKDSEVTLAYVLQHNQTDLEFLQARARRIGFEVWVQDKSLFFRPRDFSARPSLTLRREVDLLSFSARLSTLGQVTELEVRGWDPTDKRELVGRARIGDEPRAMPGGSAVGSAPAPAPDSGPQHTRRAFEQVASARVEAPVQSQQEADAMARRGFAEMALRFIRAEGVSIGQPQLRAGAVVQIDGLGERFSGHYYLTSTEHAFGRRGGYRTRFCARRNAR